MRRRIISAACLMVAGSILSGCSWHGTGKGPFALAAEPVLSAPAAPSAAAAAAAAAADPKAYAVAPDVDPLVAKACAALNVGPEIYAAIGKSTLSAESTTKASINAVVCTFVAGEHHVTVPNALTVGIRKTTYDFYREIAPDAIPGWTRQDVPGVGDTARFYESRASKPSRHMLHALEGNRMVALTAMFTTVPDGADLSAARYVAIINKVLK